MEQVSGGKEVKGRESFSPWHRGQQRPESGPFACGSMDAERFANVRQNHDTEEQAMKQRL